MKVFPDEISIWIWAQENKSPSPYGWASSNPLRMWMEQKAEKGRICTFSASLFELRPGSSALRLRLTPLSFLVLKPSDLDWNIYICILQGLFLWRTLIHLPPFYYFLELESIYYFICFHYPRPLNLSSILLKMSPLATVFFSWTQFQCVCWGWGVLLTQHQVVLGHK